MAAIKRRTLLTSSVAGGFLLLTACSDDGTEPDGPASDNGTETGAPAAEGSTAPAPEPEPEPDEVVVAPLASDTVVGLDAAGAIALSRALFERAGAVVVLPAPAPEPTPATEASPEGSPAPEAPVSPSPTASAPPAVDPTVALTVAKQLGVPLFEASPELEAELDRLGTHTVISYADDAAFGDREVVAGPAAPADLPTIEGLPLTPPPADSAAFVESAELPPSIDAMLSAAGITPVVTASGHPGETGDSTAAAKELSGPALGVGGAFRDEATLAARLETTRSVAELPGGGVTPFPGRRMIALYGHPGAPVLGMMGEQPPAETVERVKALVAEYQAHLPGETVIGAFEIITTIASSSAGSDGNYSILSSFERVLPFIEAAEANDIYVVLDLQPGRSTFLEQAKRYEELLKRPWVGLALDPEWRLLTPNARHMRQIGQVGIDEINEVGNWLADLVRDNGLPPKVLTLHQFQPRMILERERLDTSRDEIQYMVHVDGLGGQGAKQGTWAAIKKDLPAGVYLGWKNFEDEDLPMLTPQQTVEQVSPVPDFVSYQ